ncbi:AsnC/Lrp family transcriptional regulator [Methanocella paludicola SANAE]|uniref:AsnC/Lrp family transcriptional regulator n=1 Tax=Methanocella paludicola (strain DSM 17711 / JCM 13418 / NBRC 101707 / SANAE) TaxID=304371 RepID=D1YY02_METPS|nr:Lrp/AsnC family transcriptional regulator [Methanocella paludicola]BAI61324.1 AsnC/Lrp family transcriptional regulator [Methanocella paludicola SANAE]
MEIDLLNKKILQLLQKDGRITYKDITKEMDRAESTVRERIGFMEDQKIIEGYTAIINKPRVGLNRSAILYARVPISSFEEIANNLKAVNGVLQIYRTSGDKNLAFFMAATDDEELNRTIKNKVTPLGVTDIEVSIILEAVREIAEVNILSVEEKNEMDEKKRQREVSRTQKAVKGEKKIGTALENALENFRVQV